MNKEIPIPQTQINKNILTCNLNNIINSETIEDETIHRVVDLLSFIIDHPKKKIPYNILLEDDTKAYILFSRINPGIKGRSTYQIQQDKESGAAAFYQAVGATATRQATTTVEKTKIIDWQKKNEIMKQIFPPKYNDWSNFSTVEHWVRELMRYPNISNADLKYFQTEVKKWTRKRFPNNKIQRNLCAEIIFSLTSLSSNYPPESLDRVLQVSSFAIQHPNQNTPFRFLKTIEDYQLYFLSRSQWKNYSIFLMQQDRESGASAFYQALNIFTNKIAKSKTEKIQLIQSVIKEKKEPVIYNFNGEEIIFDSKEERDVVVLIHSYIDFQPKEGETIHRKINPLTKHKADVVIHFSEKQKTQTGFHGIILEYHPPQPFEKNETEEKLRKKRQELITDPDLISYKFFYITSKHQLKDFLQNDTLQPILRNGFKNKTEREVLQDLREIEKRTRTN